MTCKGISLKVEGPQIEYGLQILVLQILLELMKLCKNIQHPLTRLANMFLTFLLENKNNRFSVFQ